MFKRLLEGQSKDVVDKLFAIGIEFAILTKARNRMGRMVFKAQHNIPKAVNFWPFTSEPLNHCSQCSHSDQTTGRLFLFFLGFHM